MSIQLACHFLWPNHRSGKVVRDIQQVPHLEDFRDAYARHGVTSVVAVPIVSFGEVRAALVIRASTESFFSPDMIALLQQAAASIGLGLEAHQQRGLLLKAVHDEGRQKRSLRLLSEMVKVVSRSKDERDLLAEACCVARRSGGYSVAWIGMLDDQHANRLCLRAHDGFRR
jgi:hypothetical protein